MQRCYDNQKNLSAMKPFLWPQNADFRTWRNWTYRKLSSWPQLKWKFSCDLGNGDIGNWQCLIALIDQDNFPINHASHCMLHIRPAPYGALQCQCKDNFQCLIALIGHSRLGIKEARWCWLASTSSTLWQLHVHLLNMESRRTIRSLGFWFVESICLSMTALGVSMFTWRCHFLKKQIHQCYY